jgi:hypothetical protein
MEKEFVPYELALRMKQLGFDEPCLASYYHAGRRLDICEYINHGEYTVLAPTYSQAFRWFREKHNLLNEIVFYRDDRRTKRAYWFTIFKWDEKMTSREFVRANNELYYLTYEEAELACLEKLIEIAEGNGKEKML